MRDKEVDFVAKKVNRVMYFQCAWLLVDDQTAQREYAPLKAIPDHYEKAVVSLDEVSPPSNQGIRHIQAWKLHEVL